MGQAAQIVGWICGVVASACEGVFDYVGKAPAGDVDDDEKKMTMLWWGIAFASEVVALIHVALQCGLVAYCLVLRWRKHKYGDFSGIFVRRSEQTGSGGTQVQLTVLHTGAGDFDEKTMKPKEVV